MSKPIQVVVVVVVIVVVFLQKYQVQKMLDPKTIHVQNTLCLTMLDPKKFGSKICVQQILTKKNWVGKFFGPTYSRVQKNFV